MTPTTPSIEFKDTGVFNPTPGPTLEVGEVMTQEKLTKIESVIRELNPELQELSFGCEVEYEYKGKNGVGTIKGNGYEMSDSYSVLRNHNCNANSLYVNNYELLDYPYVNTKEMCEEFKDVYKHTYPITKIIGHPIHLENILRAIASRVSPSVIYSVDTKGVFELFSKVASFDLTKPYHLQSDEFISWLYKVLVGE